MACTNSKPAWVIGENTISFQWPKQYTPPDYWLPCRTCAACRIDQARDWAVRIAHEAQHYELNSFVTLTYDDDNLPDDGKISVHDAQKFIKRLRHHLKPLDVRYFLAGEYGEKTQRPHYHAIIFGTDFRGGKYTYRINDRLFGNKWISENIWKHGECQFADFEPATAFYTAGYVTKKFGDQETFNLMSRNPPLGKSWMERNINQMCALGTTTISGTVHPIPGRYYEWALKKGLLSEQQFNNIKMQRMEKLTKNIKSLRMQKSREINLEAKIRRKEEKI